MDDVGHEMIREAFDLAVENGALEMVLLRPGAGEPRFRLSQETIRGDDEFVDGNPYLERLGLFDGAEVTVSAYAEIEDQGVAYPFPPEERCLVFILGASRRS